MDPKNFGSIKFLRLKKILGKKKVWDQRNFELQIEVTIFALSPEMFYSKRLVFMVRSHDLYNLTAKLVVCFGPKLGL